MWQNRRVDTVASWVKLFLVPGTTWFLLVAATVAALLLAIQRTARIGRRLLAATVVLYWLMSVPAIAYALQSTQRSKFESITTPPLPNEPLPIVVVGNGLTGFNAAGARFEIPLERTATNTLFAVARYRKTPDAFVIASGGPQPEAGGSAEAEVIRDGLTRNGVPPDRILLDTRSNNTHEQAVEVARLLAARGEKRCILVTSPQQMDRALELFRREGIDALPMPTTSEAWTPGKDGGWWEWIVPSSQARAVSRDVIYEFMAWPYYRMRGWL